MKLNSKNSKKSFTKFLKKSAVNSILLFAAGLIIGFSACNSSKTAGFNDNELEKRADDSELVTNPAVVQGKLDNGLTYFVMKNSEPKNRIMLRLVVKAGSCMEEDDQRGVAHFIEHLAFNGTENFAKNSIVDFFELAGMDFGADLNAYTSFEETVYQLEIPADNPELLSTAMLIFHDWASAITFEEEEIDKERGVVTEEWRLRRGLNGRVNDALVDFLLDGSQYENRLPIGDMNIIKNISRDRILDFYKKWYRPEFMSVIVVGDAETEELEKAVKTSMNNIPASEVKIELPVFRVPPRTEKAVYVMKDPEQVTTIGEILLQEENYEPCNTVKRLRKLVEDEILGQIINTRLDEITLDEKSPWLAASTAGFGYTNHDYFQGLAFVPKDNRYSDSLKRLLDEYDRILIFGVTDSEVSRAKETMLSSAQQAWSERETISSDSIVDSLINQIVCEKTYVSPDDIYNLEKELISQITIDELNEEVKVFFSDRGRVFFNLTGENSDIPSDEQIMDIWKNYKSETELEAYVDDVPDGELMNRPDKKAEIISEEKIDDLDAVEYVLENGFRFYTKHTDFEKNTIRVTGLSKGGSAVVSEEDYPSLIYSPTYTICSGIGPMDYTTFKKAISATNISLSLNIDEHTEIFNGSTPQKDFEKFCQIITLVMTSPDFTEAGWNQVKLQADKQAQNYNVSPDSVFYEKINQTVYGKTLKRSQISPEFVEKMSPQKSEELFKQRFSNAADFSFIFTGDFDEETIVDLCCYYFGNIPGDVKARENSVYEPFNFPEGITKETVYKGIENKGRVFIGFGGKLPKAADVEQNWQDIEMMNMLQNVLDIKLREVIREDKGGSYNVSVNTELDGDSERYYKVFIYFGCEPEREDELTEEVINQVKLLQSELIDQTYIDKLTETYRRDFESNQRNNYYWLNMISAAQILNYLPSKAAGDNVSVPSWTTAEKIRELANKYLNTENYVCVFLKPEKK